MVICVSTFVGQGRMPKKDYYAILQVHPEAEIIVIEAAYRRLAREYHPDVDKRPDATERMVLLNEAYEVLSNPAARKEYNHSLIAEERVTYSKQKADHRQKPRRPYADAAIAPPRSPQPGDFGIEPDYFARACEGAEAWKLRGRALPTVIVVTLRIAAYSIGIVFGTLEFVHNPSLTYSSTLSWLMVPAACEFILFLVAYQHDVNLLVNDYGPRYSPNPHGFRLYAEAIAAHEFEMSKVYLSISNEGFHTKPDCGGMSVLIELPVYLARANGYSPCSSCGHSQFKPMVLPPPYGSSGLPLSRPR